MSSKVAALLERKGPMLSGDLARAYEKEYGVSNEAARQALSRARMPVRKIKDICFEKKQKFFYLEKQFMSQRYLDGLLQAIKSSLREYWSYIRAFDAQSGFVSKESLPAMVPSPIQNVINHKLHQRVIDDLLRHRIIEEYNETCWKLCEWVPVSSENFARSRGLETAKKQVVRDFASWAGRINLIGYHSAKMFTASAEFAHFQWALTAPSYVQPLYDDKRKKPGFLVADIFYGRTADLEDIQFFLQKLSIIRSFKHLSPFFPVLITERVTPEALKLLKERKVTVALIENIFDQRYTELLSEIVSVFTNSSAIIAKAPEKIEALFSEISKSEGRYNDMIGDMFELLVGYYYQQVGCKYLEIRKMVQVPDLEKRNEIDVFILRGKEAIFVECKATHAAIDRDFAEKWLSTNIPHIRRWFLDTDYGGYEPVFQLWSLGGFTSEAREKLEEAAGKTKKYKIEFFDRGQILEKARENKVHPVVDILQQQMKTDILRWQMK